MPSKAVDLSHHLSSIALRRERVKNERQYVYTPNKSLINLDFGEPHPEYYPFETISSQFLRPDAFPIDPSTPRPSGVLSWLTKLLTPPKAATQDLKISRYSSNDEEFPIRSIMSYSPKTSLPVLEKFIRGFTEEAHSPPYEDWDVFINIGSADALCVALEILIDPGHGCLVDAWCYNQSLRRMLNTGVVPVPVNMDAIGLDPLDLHNVLSNWDEEARGFPRPRVLLQVPVGHNPTGGTLTSERKQQIYKIASEWDLIIIEDDPYYFQQFGSYVQQSVRSATYAAEGSDDDWLKTLIPSFLRYDHEGRVLRLDTFSKTIGPGGRLGFFTVSPLLRRHLIDAQDDRSQAASGISQALIGATLLSWGNDGFIRWLRGLLGQYRFRRDLMIDYLHRDLEIEETFEAGRSLFVAYPRRASLKAGEVLAQRKALFEFVPPTAGMFIWLKLHLEHHPSFARLTLQTSLTEARKTISDQIWRALIDANVLLRPGYIFETRTEEERDAADDKTSAYFRMSYALATPEKVDVAIKALSRVLTEQFS